MSTHRKLGTAAIFLLGLATVHGSFGQNSPEPSAAPPQGSDLAAASYSLGLYFGSQLRASGLEGKVSMEQLHNGLRDGLGGKAPSEEDKGRMSQVLHDGRDALATANRVQAREFLAQNAKAEGVVTTASGLQYTILAPGDAAARTPHITDRVTVHYRGRLLDGTQFDSSDVHSMPATFRINGGVIKGWQEALQLMKPGAKWRLFVPPELAYDAASPPGIPPGSLLVFDLELVRIEPPEKLIPKGETGKGSASQSGENVARPRG